MGFTEKSYFQGGGFHDIQGGLPKKGWGLEQCSDLAKMQGLCF